MLHGDADRPGSGVLGDEGYRRLMHDRAYSAAVSALISQRTLLFIGHGALDPDLTLFLDSWQVRFGAGGPTAHWLLSFGLRRTEGGRLSRKGIEPVDLATADGEPDFAAALEAALTFLAKPLAAAELRSSHDETTTPPDLRGYLGHLESNWGAIVLTGILAEKAAASVPLDQVYVSLDATRSLSAGRDLHERGDALERLA